MRRRHKCQKLCLQGVFSITIIYSKVKRGIEHDRKRNGYEEWVWHSGPARI